LKIRIPSSFFLAVLLAVAPLSGCVDGDLDATTDLALGDRLAEDKADGEWGAALTCKPIPSFPRLAQPEIFLSLHGLTARLVDRATGFEKVFPVGVGAINTTAGETTYGESRTLFPLIATGKSTFEIRPSTVTACKTWWTDPDTGQRSPVFAGLPFMAFYGGYAFHGPIDNFRAANGGSLRRGFVSHGCVRMQSADILELYARTLGAARIPVTIQREPERQTTGARVDVNRWVGAECSKSSDCNFSGGVCLTNPVGGRGFCSLRCSGSCPDRAGAPTTFCVADPTASGQGMCVPKRMSGWPDCRALDHFVPATRSRFGGTAATASVCVPGSPGWIGDRCRSNGECGTGLRCAIAASGVPGVCTQSCTSACADQKARPRTTCVSESRVSANGRTCLRQCTPASNAPECPAGFDCATRTRANGTSANVCVPR
jgi:hypothetical protein